MKAVRSSFVSRLAVVLGLALGIAACASPPTSAPTASPLPPTAIPTVAPTAAPPPSQVIPSPETSDGLDIPASGLAGFEGWSPDSQSVAYRVGATVIHIQSVDNSCNSTFAKVHLPEPPLHAVGWQSDGQLLLVIEGGVSLFSRLCNPTEMQNITNRFPTHIEAINSVTPDGSIFLMATAGGLLLYFPQDGSTQAVAAAVAGFDIQAIWSPDLKHVALVGREQPDDREHNHVWIVDSLTGQVTSDLAYQSVYYGKLYPVPTWLNDRDVLIGRTNGTGPQVVSVDGSVTSVASHLFHLEGAALCQGKGCIDNVMAFGGYDPASKTYHVVLNRDDHRQPSPLLFHSESGQVDKLPKGSSDTWPSPDGRWIYMVPGSGEGVVGHYVPSDPTPDEDTAPKISYIGYDYWSSDGRYMAIIGAELGFIYDATNRREVMELKPLRWPALWSPDGRHLAYITLLAPDTEHVSLVEVP